MHGHRRNPWRLRMSESPCHAASRVEALRAGTESSRGASHQIRRVASARVTRPLDRGFKAIGMPTRQSFRPSSHLLMLRAAAESSVELAAVGQLLLSSAKEATFAMAEVRFRALAAMAARRRHFSCAFAAEWAAALLAVDAQIKQAFALEGAVKLGGGVSAAQEAIVKCL